MSTASAILSIQPLGFPWETRDPFLFCVHHHDFYPKGKPDMSPNASLAGRQIGQDFTVKDGWRMYHGQHIPGFPYHPHRGFETITITRTGMIDHADSLGAAGRFGNGDVQWMTAGKGVQHSEMFPMLHTDEENPLEFFQLWLNLPRAKKMVEPHFAMIWGEDVPEISMKDEKGSITKIRVITGSLNDITVPVPSPDSWAANPANQVRILDIRMEKNGNWTLPVTNSGVNRTLYFYKGNTAVVDGKEIDINHSVHLRPELTVTIRAGADQDSSFLLLEGMPINEPVAKYGPFVMNSDEEIQQAFTDYRRTQFGGWPWPRKEQVHDRKRGRFAQFADGTVETR